MVKSFIICQHHRGHGLPLYKIPNSDKVTIYGHSLVCKERWNRMFAFITALYRRGFVFKQDCGARYNAIKSTKLALGKCRKLRAAKGRV